MAMRAVTVNHVIYIPTVEDGLIPWTLRDGSFLQLIEPCAHMRVATFNGEV